MKYQSIKIFEDLKQSTRISVNSLSELSETYHFHSEYELVYIEKGKGSLVLTNSRIDFNNGYLILIGSNIPHYWNYEKIDVNEVPPVMSRIYSIYFANHSWGNEFWNLPENKNILNLRNHINAGALYSSSLSKFISNQISRLSLKPGENGLLGVYEILEALSKYSEYQIVISQAESNEYANFKIQKIYDFTIKNYQNKISVNGVAEYLNMSPQAFCRFFKKNTQKSYVKFLLELRVAHACRLLSEYDLNISEIGFQSGFNTIVNFNKYFKKLKGVNPTEYRTANRIRMYKVNITKND